ncbi:MAG: FAD-dependent oxidoreductase [Candidatus Bathyarchaeia archaeon]
MKNIALTFPEEKTYKLRENYLYDLIIIGAGPAGLTAAVYAARRKLSILLVSKDIGGQTLLTSGIENYMGYHYITGRELVNKFEEQVKLYPIDLAIGEEVKKIEVKEGLIKVYLKSGKEAYGKAAIIASGKRSRQLNVPGEKELIGRGVTYCAVCDAPLFSGMDVAVIGGGNSAAIAAIDLIKIASKVYIVNIEHSWKAESILVERIEKSEKVKLFFGYEVKEILGKDKVEAIVIKSLTTQKIEKLPVQGVFIEIGLTPNSEFAEGIVELNKAGEIIVDCYCRTSVPGVFAAGDVTNVPEKQIIIAAGEGAKAALSAYNYLLTKGGEKFAFIK